MLLLGLTQLLLLVLLLLRGVTVNVVKCIDILELRIARVASAVFLRVRNSITVRKGFQDKLVEVIGHFRIDLDLL